LEFLTKYYGGFVQHQTCATAVFADVLACIKYTVLKMYGKVPVVSLHLGHTQKLCWGWVWKWLSSPTTRLWILLSLIKIKADDILTPSHRRVCLYLLLETSLKYMTLLW